MPHARPTDRLRPLAALAQLIRILLSLATAVLPVAEKYWLTVLPVTGRTRDTLLPVAVLAAVAAAVAGTVTARQTNEGLAMGWFALVVFLASAIGFYTALDMMPRAASALYIVFFASFTLSVASFLSARDNRPRPY